MHAAHSGLARRVAAGIRRSPRALAALLAAAALAVPAAASAAAGAARTTGPDSWQSRSSMTVAREALGVSMGGDGRVYAVGGSQQEPKATVEAFDTATNSWSFATPMPT